MNDIDQKIQAALRRDSADETIADDQTLTEELVAAFRGRRRLLSATMFTVQIGALVALVFSAMRFYQASEITLQLRWGALAATLFMIMSMIKLWFWLELHSNRVLREVKRLELLMVARRQG